MGNKLMLKVLFFISNNFQNNGKITVIVGSSHSDVFRKKVEKLQMHVQDIILVKMCIMIQTFVK